MWHRNDQLEMLHEWQYVTGAGERDDLRDFTFTGEYYWRDHVTKSVNLAVRTPLDRSESLQFSMMDAARHSRFRGPYGFVDVAAIVWRLLKRHKHDPTTLLEHRLIDGFEV
jgi:hypothetical protein